MPPPHDGSAGQNGKVSLDQLQPSESPLDQLTPERDAIVLSTAPQGGSDSSAVAIGRPTIVVPTAPHDSRTTAIADLGWPSPLEPAALHGLAGQVVETIFPESEADAAALLFQYLVAFGNAAGRNAGFRAEADFHATNLYVVLVGQTSKGRKGSSWGWIGRIFEHADEGWWRDRVASGASSGEGLLWAVRDPILEQVPRKEKGKTVGYEEKETDPGVSDKRLLDVEPEFASVLRVMRRDTSTLSTTIRQAWDRGDLQGLTKNSPARARGAHISIIGHITCDELRRELAATDAANGFANRFIFVCVRRSKALPEGGNLREQDLIGLAERTKEALRFASVAGEMQRDDAARELWKHVYERLSAGKPGLFGAVTSRAEAQVMRLATTYAALDLRDVVGIDHLRAGLAAWKYSEQSARHVFGTSLGDPFADDLLDALRRAGERGLNRTELRDLFSRHKTSEEMQRALGVLQRAGLASQFARPSGGRNITIWRAV